MQTGCKKAAYSRWQRCKALCRRRRQACAVWIRAFGFTVFRTEQALRFAQEQITTKAGVRYTQITAADVTELIQKQNQLKAENAKLEKTNKRLKRLLAQMPEIIREEETLAMKLRVHDDIGHSILAARRVLLQHTDLKEIRANAALWERSISVLYRSQPDNGAIRIAGGGEKTSGRIGR